MQTIHETVTVQGDQTTIDSIVDDLHDMIAGFRCEGTGRMVKAGVSMTNMHVMWLLEHHGDLHMGQLAELLDVSMSNVTGIVDRMVERGLVERVRVPDDRRVVQVRLTPGGVQAIETMEAIKQDRLRAVLGHLDAAQRTRVAAAISDLRQAVITELGPDYGSGHDHIDQANPTGRN